MEPQTLEEDRTTLDALSAMSVDDLAETMRNAVREAEEIAPQLNDETQRAKLEIDTGRIRELYAPYVPEFADSIREMGSDDGLSTVIDSRLGTDQERDRAPNEFDLDAYDNDLDPEPVRQSPVRTLGDADNRLIDAYAARGMNGERALARIKGGLEATQETRSYWHDQEIKERMRAGDLPRSEAEREVADLHNYASGTYRAATRAISRGVSLDATEVYAPRDLIFERGRETEVAQDLANTDRESERDALVERDRDDPLVVIERDSSNDNNGPAASADDKSPDDSQRGASRDPDPDKTPEIDPTAKPSHEEFMRMIEEQEKALLKEDAKRDRERGIDRSQDIDDGFGF